jgi:hypothetical protein
VLSNPSIRGLKIGRTSNGASGVKARIKELRTTGVPESFFCEYAILVEDSDSLEKELHSFLKEYRTSTNREFFNIDPLVVKLLLEVRVNGKSTDVTKEVRSESSVILPSEKLEQTPQERVITDLPFLDNPFKNPFKFYFTTSELLSRYEISKQAFYDRLNSIKMTKNSVDTRGRSLYTVYQVSVLDKVSRLLREGYTLRQIPEVLSKND